MASEDPNCGHKYIKTTMKYLFSTCNIGNLEKIRKSIDRMHK